MNERVWRTLRRSVLEPEAKPSRTEASALCKVLGTLRTVFMKLMRDFFNVCHSDVK
jgi:hypothetical protein